VFVVEKDTVYKKYVKTGFELEDKIEIIKGLNINDIVVLNPSKDLKNGSKIKT
jgi:HlyD family secretion protein